MKLLLDENLSSAHAETLRALGHDAVSVVELGLGGQDDFANVWAMERLASVDLAGRLVVIDEHKIRIRG